MFLNTWEIIYQILFSWYDILIVSDICPVTLLFQAILWESIDWHYSGKKTVPKKQAHVNTLEEISTLRKTITSFLSIVKRADWVLERKIQFYSEEMKWLFHFINNRLTNPYC